MAISLQIKQSLSSIKIMMIEDDNIMASLIRDVLDIMGFRNVILYKDGASALQDIEINNYDLILCDWKMPGMSGIDFTKKLRLLELAKKRYTPLILITGKAQEEDVRTARDAGVTEYLIKPFSVVSMCEKVKSILERPRDFVISDAYVGPDRRRRNDKSSIPHGIDRRS
jgi:DNA-binding response OmpR family regulator